MTTTRETADHAELASVIKYLRREAASNKAKRSGQAHGAHFVTRARKLNKTADALETLLSEIAALRGEVETLMTSGIIEVAVRNPSVADYVQHWECRATQAERQRDEAVGLLKRWSLTRGEMSGAGTVETATSAFLANQGADQ